MFPRDGLGKLAGAVAQDSLAPHRPSGAAGGGVRPARSATTAVEPAGPGPAATIAGALRGRRPISVFLATIVAGYALLAGAIVGLGLLLTGVLLSIGRISDADEALPLWMARHRRPWLDEVSAVASRIGDVPVLPALVLMTLIVAITVRRFRIGAFLVAAILMELTLYRLGAMAAPRMRPAVAHLDALPVDESYPSGHAAAAVVVYGGLALLLASWAARRWVSVAGWTTACLLVTVVATSRVYRGMHHPLDILAGVLLGAGCLASSLLAVRAFGIAERLGAPARARLAPDGELA